MCRSMFVCVLASVLWSSVCCERILAVFPTPSISHQVVFRPLVLELVRRGHHLTVITPDPMFPRGGGPANLTEIDVHDVSYPLMKDMQDSANGQKADFVAQMLTILQLMPAVLNAQLQTPEVQKILKEQRNSFDLLLVEACVRAALGLAHVFGAPIIMVSSLGVSSAHYAIAGAPMHPFLYPTPIQSRIYNLSFFDKIRESFTLMSLIFYILKYQSVDYSVAYKFFGDDMPRFDRLYTNSVKMLFINEHPLWADNRPVPPNILYIGGIHQIPEKPLPNDLKSYLDGSKNGVIYISFGTNVRTATLSQDKIKAIVEAVAPLPYDVLWKWDADELPGKPDRVRTSKWLPQADLLKHPKVKVFVTQCGLQSTDEAIAGGVPLVGLPMLADQWYNAEKYVRHGVGRQLDYPTLTAEALRNAIQTVINDTSYKSNMLRLRARLRAQPVPALASAAWWAEHVARRGGDHLQPPTFGMLGLTAYYELPLLATLLFILIAIGFTAVATLLLLAKCIKQMYTTKIKLH